MLEPIDNKSSFTFALLASLNDASSDFTHLLQPNMITQAARRTLFSFLKQGLTQVCYTTKSVMKDKPGRRVRVCGQQEFCVDRARLFNDILSSHSERLFLSLHYVLS